LNRNQEEQEMRPGARFAIGAARPAGHIFYLPPEERPTDDPKTRPHFLVNRCDVSADPTAMATLAHMSSKLTEHTEYGAPAHAIVDRGMRPNSAHMESFVIAARLLARDPDRLRVSAMSAVQEVRSVRGVVLQAVGLGEGIADVTSRSVRGRLARIHDARVGMHYGCVVTKHAYSASRRYQVIVPIFDGVEHGPDGPELLELVRWDVVPLRQPWWNALPLEQPVLDTAGLISLSELWRKSSDPRGWLKPQIEIIDASIDAATLAAVEEKIAERLQQ
jgi:hypothetical protein